MILWAANAKLYGWFGAKRKTSPATAHCYIQFSKNIRISATKVAGSSSITK
jgi:hypothetical protein